MRAGFGLIALLVVVLIVTLLSRRAMQAQLPVVPASAVDGMSAAPRSMTPQQQVDAVQRQIQQSMDAAASRRASEAE
jgi:hypothetical protein